MLNQNNQLVTMSYTSIPLELVDGHYEQIQKQDDSISTYNTSSPSAKYNFTLSTTIAKTGKTNSAGEIEYTTSTIGYWSASSWQGGAEYPASGNDFILQSVPNNMIISSNSFSALYLYQVSTNNYYGRHGLEYWPESGGNGYIRYGVADDPLGLNQLEKCTLKVSC